MATAAPDIAPKGFRQFKLWLQAILDRPLTSYHLVLGSAAILLALGLMMVLSASSVGARLQYNDAYFYVKRQGFFLVLGLVGAFLLTRLSHNALRVLSWLGVGLAMLLLILTYTPLGFASGGNRNWLDLGFIAIQPSEFAKFAMIIWGADVHLARDETYLLATERTASTLATLAVDGSGRLGAQVAIRPTQAQPRGFAVTPDGKDSVTHYETLEAFRGASLLEVHLETGRTHQIRVHLAAHRHPCVGDPLYGADPTLSARLGLTRQWLHARELSFAHPGTREWVTFASEYPADLAHALDVLRDE